MPIFYFHVRDGERLTEDPNGAELLDLAAAEAKARTAIREAATRPLKPGQNLAGRRFEIADESGRVVATVTFRDVLGLH